MPCVHKSPGKRDLLLENVADGLLRAANAPELVGKIAVYWSKRLVSSAGMACYRRKCILLHPALAEVGADEVNRTLRHELAHFLAYHRAGRRRIAAHGPEWKKACADLGIPGEKRCHNLPLRKLLKGTPSREKPMHVTPAQNGQPAANSYSQASTSPKTSHLPSLSRPQKWVQMLLFPWLSHAPQARKQRRSV